MSGKYGGFFLFFLIASRFSSWFGFVLYPELHLAHRN
jgi:hypothetical protein